MCGIVAAFTKNKAPVDTKLLIERYCEQRTRGNDGFGFTYLTKAGRAVTRRFQYEAECFAELGKVRSPMIVLHHRFPTSTKNNTAQNQPITNASLETGKKFIIAHNGVINNADELYKLHPEHYETFNDTSKNFNDSEALLVEVMHHLEDRKPIAARGSIACIVLECDPLGTLEYIHFMRNTNPLYVDKVSDTLYMLSSTHPTIKYEHMIAEGVFYSFDWKKKSIQSRKVELPTYVSTKPSTTNPASRYTERGYYDKNNVWHSYSHGTGAAGFRTPATPTTTPRAGSVAAPVVVNTSKPKDAASTGSIGFDMKPETPDERRERFKRRGANQTKGDRALKREMRREGHLAFEDAKQNALEVLQESTPYDPMTCGDEKAIRILTEIDDAIEALDNCWQLFLRKEPNRVAELKRNLVLLQKQFLKIMDYEDNTSGEDEKKDDDAEAEKEVARIAAELEGAPTVKDVEEVPAIEPANLPADPKALEIIAASEAVNIFTRPPFNIISRMKGNKQ